MRITIENLNNNPANALRKCGYHFERQHTATEEISAARDLAPGGFPRLHCYAKYTENKRGIEINLHLDQKRPSYSGTSAHGGEYEGEIVEQEADRIKSILEK